MLFPSNYGIKSNWWPGRLLTKKKLKFVTYPFEFSYIDFESDVINWG